MYLLRHCFFSTLIFLFLIDCSTAKEITTAVKDSELTVNKKILDLNTAVSIALRDSPGIKAAQQKIYMAEQAYKKVRSEYLPEVNMVCSAIKKDLSDTEYTTSKLQSSITGLKASRAETYYNAGLSAKWVLFNGFQRKYSLSVADSDITINKYGQDNVVRKLLFSVADTYFTAQLAMENINVLKADRIFFQQLLEDAKTLKTSGKGSLNDELSFKVKLNTVEAELITAEQGYSAILSRLAVLLGYKNGWLPSGTRLATLQYGNGGQFRTDDVSSLISYALNNRPDILQYHSLLERADAEVKIAYGRMLPHIWIEGLVTGTRQGDGQFETEDFGDSVAIKLSYNIFSGGADRSGIIRAKAGQLEKKYDYQQLKSQICSDVNNAFNRLKSSIKTYKLYRQNAFLSQKNRDLVKIEYTAGKCSLVRLNEVQKDHSLTKISEALALAGVFQAKFQLEASTGRIHTLF